MFKCYLLQSVTFTFQKINTVPEREKDIFYMFSQNNSFQYIMLCTFLCNIKLLHTKCSM